jgi:hypothetical protein
MPYNILNKKQWLGEIDSLTNTYIDFINKLASSKNETELDIVLSKKYKSNDLIFTGQEIVDNIRKKLAEDTNYVYEFRTMDNKPIVKRIHRVSFDDKVGFSVIEDLDLDEEGKTYRDRKGIIHKIKTDNIIVTIEDLKSKHVESLMKIEELKEEVQKLKDENKAVFLELVEALGGLYQYSSKKKLILMLSKVLKELGFYDSEKGTQYSYEGLSAYHQDKVINALYDKVYHK